MKRVIYVRRTRDPIELGSPDEWEGIDVEETMARYDDLVTERIAEEFPDAEVCLDDGPWGADGYDDRNAIIARSRAIADDVYADQEWVVWL